MKHWSMFAGVFGLAAYVSYFLLFDFSRLVGNGTMSPVTVAWMPNLIALAFAVVHTASWPAKRS